MKEFIEMFQEYLSKYVTLLMHSMTLSINLGVS